MLLILTFGLNMQEEQTAASTNGVFFLHLLKTVRRIPHTRPGQTRPGPTKGQIESPEPARRQETIQCAKRTLYGLCQNSSCRFGMNSSDN